MCLGLSVGRVVCLGVYEVRPPAFEVVKSDLDDKLGECVMEI
jgi:hypothetical protein